MNYIALILLAAVVVSCSQQAETPVTDPVAAKTDKPADLQKTVTAQKPAVPPGKITGVEMGQVFTMLQTGNVHLVDVRPPLFFHLGHIDGAVNFPLKKYEASSVDNLPLIEQALASGKVVVLYCQNVKCPDAYKTAQKLIKLGHSVSIYKGGWEEWKKAGLQ